jgi:hypothetical protein
MLEIKHLADDQIELVVTGKTEKEDVDAAIKALEAAQPESGKLHLIMDLSGFSGMTMEALMSDLRYGITHLNSLDRYGRAAVITDADWMEALVWIEDKVLRRIDIACFEPDERDQALAFINGEDPRKKHYEPSVIRVPADRDDILAFRIHDKLREADAKAIFGILGDAYERHDKVDLLVIIDDFEGFEPSMMFESDLWSGKWNAISNVRKYGVIGGPSFARGAASFFGAFLPMEIRTFERGDEKDAWQWIGATPLIEA